ncbi:MAG TPA: hypothetical protein VM681_07190 [Candidatus Thermoplasmatota archaeon]|nr:hypothetical protein [Candidatus Thermoplasmatota archaeon]
MPEPSARVRAATLLALCLPALALLHVLPSGVPPPPVSLSDLPLHEGRRVAIVATVGSVTTTTHGAALRLVADDASTVLLARGDTAAEKGDLVRAVGTPSRSARGIVFFAEAQDVVVIRPAA